MKERPILFSAPMVRALLDGSKTQTRRPVQGIPLSWLEADLTPGFVADPENNICSYGQLGDRLWVRESFWGCDLPGYGDQPCVVYDDEWVGKDYQPAVARPWGRKFGRIPSIHMPRESSRILLEVVSVRVERLNDCSEADAIAEGIERNWIGDLATGPNGLVGKAGYLTAAGGTTPAARTARKPTTRCRATALYGNRSTARAAGPLTNGCGSSNSIGCCPRLCRP